MSEGNCQGALPFVVIRNKPTFDPYSLSEFSTRDLLRSAYTSWRTDRLGFVLMALLATLPTAASLVLSSIPSIIVSSLVMVFFIAVVAPTVARRVRGLSADFRGTLVEVLRNLHTVVGAGVGIALLVATPGLILLPWGPGAAYIGLAIGVCISAPFGLSVPVVIVEGLGLFAAMKRSLFLIRGRLLRAGPPLFLTVLAAAFPEALRVVHPEFAPYTLVIQPVFVILAGLGFGALYLVLSER